MPTNNAQRQPITAAITVLAVIAVGAVAAGNWFDPHDHTAPTAAPTTLPADDDPTAPPPGAGRPTDATQNTQDGQGSQEIELPPGAVGETVTQYIEKFPLQGEAVDCVTEAIQDNPDLIQQPGTLTPGTDDHTRAAEIARNCRAQTKNAPQLAADIAQANDATPQQQQCLQDQLSRLDAETLTDIALAGLTPDTPSRATTQATQLAQACGIDLG